MKIAVFIALLIAVVTAWVWWPFAVSPQSLIDADLEKRGLYGDSFGPLNTLFTGLAFSGVAFSIYLQLKAERKRLDERKKDEFETRLFHLVDAVRSHVSHMDVKISKRNSEGEEDEIIHHGRDCFKAILTQLVEKMEDEINGVGSKKPLRNVTKDMVIHSYDIVYKRHQDDLGPYFRMLYHVFRFINNSNVTTSEKEDYADFVRAELCSAELCLIEINSLTPRGQKFKALVETFNIAKHAPRNTRFDPENAIAKEFRVARQGDAATATV